MPNSITIENFNAYYGNNHALKNIHLEIPPNTITAFIGPSGCGKTTLLRSINRLNDLVSNFQCNGSIRVGPKQVVGVMHPSKISELRMGIGYVFQQANLLPTNIYKNMIVPLVEHYKLKPEVLKQKVIQHLDDAAILDEVSHRLDQSALTLSGGQQQRLCIARALMLDPEVLLLDEPCSALDPISTATIETLLVKLKKQRTVVIVTHNMEQAARISDYTAFFYNGEIVEWGLTADIFVNPKTDLCARYISGKM